MKIHRIILILLIGIMAVQAHPQRRHHSHPGWQPYHQNNWYGPRHSHYYSPYWSYRYYTPVMVTTRTITTYPSNLVIITVEHVAEDIVILNNLMTRGMITEKEYERAKKTLLNRIGMSINPEAAEPTTKEITSQIKTLYQMREGQLLTNSEYQKQKQKLLATI
ncbi:SHOCT domain-containing protein [bacterium]|nr:SHOCT domain-containing protein [bacterium]